MTLDFNTAFKYPFNRKKGLWNILWLLVPIIGWFALGGYGIRIVKEFTLEKFEQLPEMSFKSDLKFGFMMFLKSLPFVVIYTIILGTLIFINEWFRIIDTFLKIFIVPILTVHFFNKETIGSWFDFKILEHVFINLWEYIIIMLKSLALFIVYLLMTIILVGIPANAFTQNIYVADFYRSKVKNRP